MQNNIHISYQHVPRFRTGDSAATNYLEEHGYVIFANALTATEASKAVGLLWDYLEEL